MNIKDNIKDKYQVPDYGEVLRVGGHGNVCTSVDAVQLEVCRLQHRLQVEDPWLF